MGVAAMKTRSPVGPSESKGASFAMLTAFQVLELRENERYLENPAWGAILMQHCSGSCVVLLR